MNGVKYSALQLNFLPNAHDSGSERIEVKDQCGNELLTLLFRKTNFTFKSFNKKGKK